MRRSRFTLIELMTVLVIVLILFGISFGALQGITTKKGTEGGVRMISRMVEMTKQYAITENLKVALVFPLANAGDTSYPVTAYSNEYELRLPNEHTDVGLYANGDKDNFGILMRPAVIKANTNNVGSLVSYVFVKWVPESKWIILPNNTYFTVNSGLTTITGVYDDANADVDGDGTVDEHYGAITADENNTTDAVGIMFRPTGSLINVEDVYIRVKPFSYTDSTDGVNYDPDKSHRYMIHVNWLTGKLSVMSDVDPQYKIRYGTH